MAAVPIFGGGDLGTTMKVLRFKERKLVDPDDRENVREYELDKSIGIRLVKRPDRWLWTCWVLEPRNGHSMENAYFTGQSPSMDTCIDEAQHRAFQLLAEELGASEPLGLKLRWSDPDDMTLPPIGRA